MTQAAPFRKAVFLCAALAAASGLSACGNQDLGKTFAEIKALDIDENAGAADSPKKINKKDVELVVNTARDMTVGQGGLLDKGSRKDKVEIAVVDPLQLPPAAEPTLEVETPTADTARSEAPVSETPVKAPAGRSIQVGSYGSLAAAQNAWQTLRARYPGVEQYSPTFQPVTTAAGKSLVRLKVGPVIEPGQAERLCSQLDIRDAWCSKAS